MPDDLNAPITDAERLEAARSASDDYDFLADVCDATGGIIDHDDITFEPRCVVALLDALCLARRRERALREALAAVLAQMGPATDAGAIAERAMLDVQEARRAR